MQVNNAQLALRQSAKEFQDALNLLMQQETDAKFCQQLITAHSKLQADTQNVMDSLEQVTKSKEPVNPMLAAELDIAVAQSMQDLTIYRTLSTDLMKINLKNAEKKVIATADRTISLANQTKSYANTCLMCLAAATVCLALFAITIIFPPAGLLATGIIAGVFYSAGLGAAAGAGATAAMANISADYTNQSLTGYQEAKENYNSLNTALANKQPYKLDSTPSASPLETTTPAPDKGARPKI